MIRNLYTFGCSLTKDTFQDTWADILAEKFSLKLHNRAERGAGADFISKRVLTSTDITSDDSLVAIMWPCADRFDLWADHTVPHLLDDQIYASWVDGNRPALIDMHGHRGQYQGYILNGSIPRGYKHKWYKFFYSPYQAIHDWYTRIIQTQLVLQSRKQRVIMMAAFALDNPLHCHVGEFNIDHTIFGQIDQDLFVGPCMGGGFQSWCVSNNLGFTDPHHPNSAAHAMWVDKFMFDRMQKILYTDTHN